MGSHGRYSDTAAAVQESRLHKRKDKNRRETLAKLHQTEQKKLLYEGYAGSREEMYGIQPGTGTNSQRERCTRGALIAYLLYTEL